MQTLFNNGHQQVNRDRDPDLGAHRVLARAVEGFDAQMLLDPFEEQFDVPATLIELRNRQRGHGEVVGQKHQRLARLRIAIANAAQRLRIRPLSVEAAQHHGLVETQTGALVHRVRITPLTTEVFLGASNEESRMLLNPMQARKVQIAPVHDVERTRLVNELVENVHVVDAARRDNDHGGKVALQAQQGVEFDRRFVSAESGPRKERQAQVDGCGVQCIGGLLKLGGKRFVGVESGGLLNEDLSEIGEDAPVARLVGVGERAAGGGLANAAVIEFGSQSAQTGFDVAQTLAPGQLGKSHDDELFVAGQLADPEVAAIALNTLVEFVFGQAVQQLGENGATFVHKESGPPRGGARPCERASSN